MGDITSDVDTSEQAVSEIRKEIAPGTHADLPDEIPADRIPKRDNLVAMLNSGVGTAAIANTNRCIRLVTIPLKGGRQTQVHCSKACVFVGNSLLCPEHDREAFQPQQTPHGTKKRITNSASISLSSGELKALGMEHDPSTHAGPRETPSLLKPLAPPADRAGQVNISFSLDELSGSQLLKLVSDRLCEALDSLPCANLRQMKQMAAIQAKVGRIARKAPRTRNPEEGNGQA